MKQWFLNRSQQILLAVTLLCAVGWMGIGMPMTQFGLAPRFDWPDETANYFWIHQYTTTGTLVVDEPLNQSAENQIHPRSFNVRADGSLVPGSFVGMILLFGFIAGLVGIWVIPFITPVLAFGAVWAWYGIIRQLFNERLALVSALLLLFHPAWWYYAASPLLPNVAFVSLLLIGFWLILANRGLLWKWAFAGLAIGAAVSIRPSEIIWVGALGVATLVYAWTHYRARRIIGVGIFVIISCAMLIPTLLQQQVLYGGALASGYNQLQNGPAVCTSCEIVKGLVAPFGIDIVQAVKAMVVHLFARLWWLTVPALLGLFLIFTQPDRKVWFVYLSVVGVLTAWLGVYYGSWEFADQMTVNLNTLGISYVRYWLPIYIALTPFIALAIIWAAQLVTGWRRVGVTTALLALLFIPSANAVLFARADSLIPVKQRIAEYYDIATQVNAITPENAVIVTVRKDKVFFPERRVIHSFDSLSQNQELQRIISAVRIDAPVYYYALAPESVTTLGYGLELEFVQSFNSEILYRVYQAQEVQ